jgi:hypothetical protein
LDLAFVEADWLVGHGPPHLFILPAPIPDQIGLQRLFRRPSRRRWLAPWVWWVAATAAAGRVTQITLHLPQNELNTHSPDQKQEACQGWDKQ